MLLMLSQYEPAKEKLAHYRPNQAGLITLAVSDAKSSVQITWLLIIFSSNN